MSTRAYAILSAIGADPEAVVDSMMSLRRCKVPTIYLHRQEDPAPAGPEMKAIEADCRTTGCMVETARRLVDAELYVWIPPGVTVTPQGIDDFISAFEENPDASLIVSNYVTDGDEVAIHPLRDDLTEREDFGAVWALPARALEQVGGLEKDLKFATFYDLRLKLAEVGELVHIHVSTHTIPSAPEEGEADASAALFYPGKGAFGGFSYLFMDPEEEREVEQALYACLQRRGAWLEAPGNTVKPAAVAEGDPIVSVVIPVHNRAGFLPMAIESVLAGELQDFEIIIVDNASTDNSRDVARGYAEKDERIRLLENEQNVIAQALNKGVREARGRYIAQLDSDDEYTPNTLKDMVGQLENHPEAGLAISYYELIDEAGEVLDQFGIIKHLEYNRNNILRVDGAGAVRVWHRSVIEEFGGFNETDYPNYGEDYDLVLKVGERYEVDRVHEICYHYRRHPGNTDALRLPADKIRAKTAARTAAIARRRAINGQPS